MSTKLGIHHPVRNKPIMHRREVSSVYFRVIQAWVVGLCISQIKHINYHLYIIHYVYITHYVYIIRSVYISAKEFVSIGYKLHSFSL